MLIFTFFYCITEFFIIYLRCLSIEKADGEDRGDVPFLADIDGVD